jgi:hypothetical protein
MKIQPSDVQPFKPMKNDPQRELRNQRDESRTELEETSLIGSL